MKRIAGWGPAGAASPPDAARSAVAAT
jgi:mannose/fructose/N-acetylgalactosamine-specific phosphotransferase system component IIC